MNSEFIILKNKKCVQKKYSKMTFCFLKISFTYGTLILESFKIIKDNSSIAYRM